MVKNRLYKSLSQWLFVMALVAVFAMPSFAANLNLKYEQVVTDRYGNELGYRTTTINSIDDLPVGSPWRSYLNTKLQSGKTIYEYASSISKSLSQNLNLTLSDRDSNSYTAKGSNGGYTLNIYNYVNDFATDSSKSFLFLHEFGHVTMLNSYPRSYDFVNLDYGSDNRHYLDEILPNYNTAWVEGWANAFAAANNNGLVFSYDLKSKDSLAFLKENSFDEMCHNELFVAKVLYDSFKDIKGGQNAAYDVFAKTAPHSSLLQFCQNYVKLYPGNKVGLAKILVENSYGKISLNELLAYVNGGSKTVTQELYDYLSASGMLNGTAQTQNTSKPKQTASTGTSFWSKITSFFQRLFGRENASSPAEVAQSTNVGTVGRDEEIYSRYTDGTISISRSVEAPENVGAASPENCEVEGSVSSNLDTMSLAEAQELYYKYFSEYNALMADSNSDRQKVAEARNKMVQAKNLLKKLQSK